MTSAGTTTAVDFTPTKRNPLLPTSGLSSRVWASNQGIFQNENGDEPHSGSNNNDIGNDVSFGSPLHCSYNGSNLGLDAAFSTPSQPSAGLVPCPPPVQLPPVHQTPQPSCAGQKPAGVATGGGESTELINVLHQVSAMTMNEPPRHIHSTPRNNHNLLLENTPPAFGGPTPSSSNAGMLQTPDQKQPPCGLNFTPDFPQVRNSAAGKPQGFFLPQQAMEAKRSRNNTVSSPMCWGRKKVRNTASTPNTATDSRVFTAPPLPSSPELSVGRVVHAGALAANNGSHNAHANNNNTLRNPLMGIPRAVPPQFSPIANLRLATTAPAVPSFPLSPTRPAAADTSQSEDDDEDFDGDNSDLQQQLQETHIPAPMPWLDTPEQPERKRVVSVNQLKMRKRNLSGIHHHHHPSLPFGS